MMANLSLQSQQFCRFRLKVRNSSIMKHFLLILIFFHITLVNSLRIYIPNDLNYAGSEITNLSLSTPRLYRIDDALNDNYVERFVQIHPTSGVLSLKHSLRCRSEQPNDVVPLPLNVYVQSRTYSIDGSSIHLSLQHIELYFEHDSCDGTSLLLLKNQPNLLTSFSDDTYNHHHHPHHHSNNINNQSFLSIDSLFNQLSTSSLPSTRILLSFTDETICLRQSQFLTRIREILPQSLSKCSVLFHVLDSDFSSFKIQQSSTDLIALSTNCLTSGSSFDIRIGMLYNCDNNNNHHHHHHHRDDNSFEHVSILSSDKIETIILTFYPRNSVDIDEYIQNIKYKHSLQPQQHSHHHNHHLHNHHHHSNELHHNSHHRSRRELSSSSSSGPSFDRSLYIVNVPEEREKAFVVTQISATHAHDSSSELLYSMSALIDARSQSMFAIDSVSGLITTTTRLDREFMDVHYLRITVTDSSNPPRSASTTLQINVQDENDHVPMFEHANYEASLKESVPIGTTVLTVRATDQDSGSNADIEYSILNPTGLNEAFRIDTKAGSIITRSTLDREKIDLYTLTVQASDSGPLQSRKRSQTSVSIKILDENDNYPQFSERSYSTAVDEDVNYASRPVIIRIVAHDSDEGLNAAVRYSIIGGNTAAAFAIDSLNGEVSVVGPLDYENVRSYRLVIRAQDGGSPPRSNTTQLLVNVVDKNDNEPRFYTTLFQENVLENVPIGTSVVRVQAFDADDGENAQLSYHIQTSNGASSIGSSSNNELEALSRMPLNIDPISGWIVTTRELDREESSLYEFTVVAKDSGQMMQHTATASVIIRVQDLNDNAPVFEPKIYEAVIPETATLGTPVVTVSATDRDENPRLVFQITGGNMRNRFSIVSQNNQGHITVANLLDYKIEKNFVLSVSATDSGGKSDLATVYINVTDANTHRPVIQLKSSTGVYGGSSTSLLEDSPIGTVVMIVEAIDDDVGENARITYSLNDIEEFRIDPNTGTIVTTKLLDRESVAGYSLVVTAQDNGIPALSDIANIEIEIIDVNDNVPKFEQEFYTANVMEDAPIGTSVVQVKANDRDLGLNGQVRYEFDQPTISSTTGPDYHSLTFGVFSIDPTSGVIRTNKTLDRETVAKYELKVLAIDRGTPQLSSTVTVHVTIDDCNDNPPRFSSDRLRFYVPENSPIGSVVGELRATDADEGANARIEYTIVGGPDMKWFALKSSNSPVSSDPAGLSSTSGVLSSLYNETVTPSSVALLVTRTEMDFESDKKIYNIIVRAASLPLRNDVEVEIHVTDVNDHAPLLRDFSIIFNNYRGHFPLGQIIGKVPAYDADIADQLRYRFVAGNKANLLYLNESSGELRLSPSLNTNVPTRAELEVSISDGINEAVARCFLSVNLVTESMLAHSVTLRLNSITKRAFLSTMYDKFVDSLASIIPCPRSNVVVFNIQDDTESVLNISFSARVSDSLRDTETYYSPQFLQERVYLSRTLLTRLTDLQVLPFEDNICVREPCLNYESCSSVLKFGNSSEFFGTDAMLFRAISPINTFVCKCPIGFQGMHHKYECDTEINLCFSSPCQNGGQCVHQESGYVCICPDGYTGKNCDINFETDFCKSGLCKGGSRCVNAAGRAMKVKPGMVRSTFGLDKALLDSSEGGFVCADCQYQEWGSQLCQLRSRSFVPGSYLTFSSLKQRHRLNLRLRFATREPNGLLLYNGRYNEKHDFVGLELIAGRIYFTFSLGDEAHAEVSVGDRLNDGQWHEIEVNYYNRSAILKLDGCDEALLNSIDRFELGPEFVCANRTKLEIEERCNDRMQSCYRFLDLAGPLQIGGLPPLPTSFQVRNNDFSGCISDLYIDYDLIDLDSYVANNGSVVGCEAKKSYCSVNTCHQRGQCEDAWNGAVCRCDAGFTGPDCAFETEATRHFKGDGFLAFSPNLQPLSYPWIVTFDMKSTVKNGLIMAIHLGQTSLVRWEIIGGKLSLAIDDRSPIVVDDTEINDGKWHHIEVRWTATGITLHIDYGQHSKTGWFDGIEILGLYIAKVTVGGHDTPDEMTDAYQFRSLLPNYVGCIQALDVGNSRDSWLRPTLENSVFSGCASTGNLANSCSSNPCPANSDCVSKSLTSFECKCHRGFVGKQCVPVCELAPCTGSATCAPSNSSRHGYRCLCDRHHSGFYCEDRLPETCPSDWWGYPICGPCNCDVTKGYDGNCNKTTGECSCQLNRYQPVGSDVCYECDCYQTGSYSSRCDRTTGQCQCRPGVIGRRCDSCASPFAEVTARGCEVIYDACPRTFTDGVWWERTHFGGKAVQKCPQGSNGFGERECRQGDGWLRPNLFGCLSDQFVDLSEQWKILEESDKNSGGIENGTFLLYTQHSIKLAQDLRSAINETETLFGSDIQLSFKLIQRLIQNELRQSGLNLTHKQDRHFMRNLLESTSSILEPRYVAVWEQISEQDNVGPEQFLKLFNQYSQVLIDNQRDTFTEPFEIVTKWVIFGLDTVSTNELWDINRELLLRTKKPLSQNDNDFEQLPTPMSTYHPFNQTPVTSVYLDQSLPIDPLVSGSNKNIRDNPGVVIPKYNNYPMRKHNIDDITRAIVPLRLLNVPTLEEYRQMILGGVKQTLQQTQVQAQNSLVAYSIFPSLSHFLPSYTDSTVRQRFSMPLKANTPVVTMTMKTSNGSKFLTKSLHPKLHFRFRTLVREGRSSPQCVYWSFPAANSVIQHQVTTSGSTIGRKTHNRGRWSSKGCEVKGVYPANKFRAVYDYVNCSCDRGFGVAVIMDISGDELYFEESIVQVAVSYSFVTVSLVLLALTYLILTFVRGMDTNSNAIHRNLVLCIFITELIFLLGVRARTSLVQFESICKLVAISLHYVFQCLFTWMLIESIHLYRMLTEIRDVNHGPMRFYYFLGYTAPAIIVALSVGVRADQYGNHLFCWLSIYEGVIWGLVAPICIVIVLNLFVFLLAMQASVQIKATVCDYGNLRTMLWLSIILLPLLAIFWILALLAVNDAVEELHYAYSVLTLISAVYIFVSYCLVNRRVRQNIQVGWQRVTSGNRSPHPDESFSGTRTSMFHQSQGQFDVYGMRQSNPDNILQQQISSSSNTSSVAKHNPGDVVDEGPYGQHTHGHRNRKCSRRHRHHRHHRSKQSITVTDTGSSDDASSYNRSLDLASSHSSDDEDDTPNIRTSTIMRQQQQLHHHQQQPHEESLQHENKLNTLIQEQHSTLYGSTSNAFLQRTLQANDSTSIYGSRGQPAVLMQNTESSQSQILTSTVPFSRSNILAMTAGLVDSNSPMAPPSPAPPVVPMAQISPVYVSRSQLGAAEHPTNPSQSQTEHIYAFARKPTSSVIYSSVNKAPAPVGDDVGIPQVPISSFNPTFGTSSSGEALPGYSTVGSSIYQTPKENPYGISTSNVICEPNINHHGHVRLLNADKKFQDDNESNPTTE